MKLNDFQEGDRVLYLRKQGDMELVRVRFINPKDPERVEVFFPSTQESWWVRIDRLEPIDKGGN